MKFVEAADTSCQAHFYAGPCLKEHESKKPPVAIMSGNLGEVDSSLEGWTHENMTVAVSSVTPSETVSAVVVTVGSDEGHSMTTLKRLATLTADLLRMLGFTGTCEEWYAQTIENIPKLPTGSLIRKQKQNFLTQDQKRYAQMVVNYVYLEMEKCSPHLYLQAVPINRALTVGVGIDDYDSMVSGLFHSFMRDTECQDFSECPGYGCLFFGNRLLEETGKKTEEACRSETQVPVLKHYSLSKGDRFLIHILTMACGGAPGKPLENESEQHEWMRKTELELLDFNINRHNVGFCEAEKEALLLYVKHLEEDDGRPSALQEAQNLVSALETLLEHDASFYNYDAVNDVNVAPDQNGFHNRRSRLPTNFDDTNRPPGEVSALPKQLLACYERSDFKEFPRDEGNNHLITIWVNGGKTQAVLSVIHVMMPDSEEVEEDWIQSDSMFGIGPRGVDAARLYFPKERVVDPDTKQEEVGGFYPWKDELEASFRRDLGNYVAWGAFYLDDFVQQPSIGPGMGGTPPGLQYYCYVDRSTNSCVCSNLEAVANLLKSGKCPHSTDKELQEALLGLHRLMINCISESHRLQADGGYQEGIWGHLGFQFHFSISVEDVDGKDNDTAGGSAAPTAGGGNNGSVSSPGTSSANLGAQASTGLGSSGGTGLALDYSLRDTFAHAPYRLGDELYPSKKGEGHKVTELYALYVGTLRPDEISNSAATLLDFIRKYEKKCRHPPTQCTTKQW